MRSIDRLAKRIAGRSPAKAKRPKKRTNEHSGDKYD